MKIQDSKFEIDTCVSVVIRELNLTSYISCVVTILHQLGSRKMKNKFSCWPSLFPLGGMPCSPVPVCCVCCYAVYRKYFFRFVLQTSELCISDFLICCNLQFGGTCVLCHSVQLEVQLVPGRVCFCCSHSFVSGAMLQSFLRRPPQASYTGGCLLEFWTCDPPNPRRKHRSVGKL